MNYPTLTAFVSKESDEKKTYKSGDKVKFKQGMYERIGELHYDGWSIYDMNSPPNQIVVLDDNTVQRKGITMTPYDPSQSQPSGSDTPVYSNYGGLDSHPTSTNGWGGVGGRSRRRSRKSRKSRKSRR